MPTKSPSSFHLVSRMSLSYTCNLSLMWLVYRNVDVIHIIIYKSNKSWVCKNIQFQHFIQLTGPIKAIGSWWRSEFAQSISCKEVKSGQEHSTNHPPNTSEGDTVLTIARGGALMMLLILDQIKSEENCHVNYLKEKVCMCADR